jgi:hypothetical protein
MDGYSWDGWVFLGVQTEAGEEITEAVSYRWCQQEGEYANPDS